MDRSLRASLSGFQQAGSLPHPITCVNHTHRVVTDTLCFEPYTADHTADHTAQHTRAVSDVSFVVFHYDAVHKHVSGVDTES